MTKLSLSCYRQRQVLLICLTVGLLVLFSTNAELRVYKWTDEDGKVSYGDKPEQKDADEVKIKQASPQDLNVQGRNQEQNKLLHILQQERNEKTLLRKEDKAKQEEQQRQCAETRKVFQKMRQANYLYKGDDNDPDNREIVSDQQRQIEEKKYSDYLNKNC